ncbi:MAG: hypothetical protein IKC77_04030 [Lentisphaeria bacterium]|nr:hypothetical protein [Lentisphaeria bacterium]
MKRTDLFAVDKNISLEMNHWHTEIEFFALPVFRHSHPGAHPEEVAFFFFVVQQQRKTFCFAPSGFRNTAAYSGAVAGSSFPDIVERQSFLAGGKPAVGARIVVITPGTLSVLSRQRVFRFPAIGIVFYRNNFAALRINGEFSFIFGQMDTEKISADRFQCSRLGQKSGVYDTDGIFFAGDKFQRKNVV